MGLLCTQKFPVFSLDLQYGVSPNENLLSLNIGVPDMKVGV